MKRYRKLKEMRPSLDDWESSMTTSSLRPAISKLKLDGLSSITDIHAGLNMNGRDVVSTTPLSAKSFQMTFSMDDNNRVANYSDTALEEYWNAHVIQQPMWRLMRTHSRHGVIRRALPTVCLYLLGHYTVALT